MSTLVGMLLSGRYRLDAQIGAGGMSTVYKAFDVNLERRVAIKLLHREMSADSDQLERFRREARAVAQLSHPHIVGVIDAGEDENRPYIVFEYVEGETLKDRIRRLGRLPIDESLAYAIEIARALGSAHAHEIVHRDVKPQNVLLDPEGSAKVTDFGIARSLRDDGLTADGRVLGTTDYVSPEQALGHDVDGQSDIYSLGVVLYEMLTGDVPFHGENQISVAMKHVREDLPDIQRMRPEVSATTAAVLDRMTEKDLAHRYADIPMLVADLEDALAIEAARSGTSTGEATAVIRTLPAHARRRLPFRMRHPISLLAVVALVGGGGRRRRADHRPARRPRRQAPARHRRRQGVRDARGHARGLGPARLARTTTTRSATTRSTPSRPRARSTATRARRGRPSSTPPGLEGANKAGVGLYIDAKPRVEAVEMQIETPEPGLARDDLRRAARATCRSRSTRAGRRSAAARSTARTSASSSTRAASSSATTSSGSRSSAPDAERAEISEIRLLPEGRAPRSRDAALGREALERERAAGGRRAPGTASLTPPTASGRRSWP